MESEGTRAKKKTEGFLCRGVSIISIEQSACFSDSLQLVISRQTTALRIRVRGPLWCRCLRSLADPTRRFHAAVLRLPVHPHHLSLHHTPHRSPSPSLQPSASHRRRRLLRSVARKAPGEAQHESASRPCCVAVASTATPFTARCASHCAAELGGAMRGRDGHSASLNSDDEEG